MGLRGEPCAVPVIEEIFEAEDSRKTMRGGVMADVRFEKGVYSVIGTKQPYIDAYDKVTGRTNYNKRPFPSRDASWKGPAQSLSSRSDHFSDTSAAEKVPGIKCVLTGKNVRQNK